MTKRSMFGAFKEWGGDLYVKQVGPRRYHVIRVEHTEEWGDNAQDQYGKYCVSLSEVDLDLFDWALVCDVLRSCSWRLVAHEDTGLPAVLEPYSGCYVAEFPHVDACLLDASVGYGARAPLHEDSGNNLQKLARACIAESRSLCADADEHREAMEGRMVNAIGTCPRDYMLGNLGFRRDTQADKLASILMEVG